MIAFLSSYRLGPILALGLLSWFCFPVWGQRFSLEDCQSRALELSPLRQQQLLMASAAHLQDENLQRRWLPAMSLRGQGVWLSETITFPSLGPGAEFPQIPQFQYQVTLQLEQLIYEGGQIRQARELSRLEAAARKQQSEVDYLSVKSIINELYMGLLLLQKQDSILTLSQTDLAEQRKVLASGVNHGAILPGSLQAFDQEALNLRQERLRLASEQTALRASLGEWIGVTPTADWLLQVPMLSPDLPVELARPEHQLLDLRKQQLQLQAASQASALRPQISAFAQGGLGQPNPFNFLETRLDPFAQVGVRLQWRPWDWKHSKREQERLGVEVQVLDQQREQFDHQLRSRLQRDRAFLQSLPESLTLDRAQIQLQEQIVQQSASQLQHGVIRAAAYLRDLNTLRRLRLQYELRRLRGVQTQLSLQTQSGF